MPKFTDKIADVPHARPGFDAIGITAPIMMQMNPSGKWESSEPEHLDQEQLEKVLKYLVKSNAVNALQTYCSKCAEDNKRTGGGGKSKYVPVIMMPIYSAKDCPFDMNPAVNKLDHETKAKKRHQMKTERHKPPSDEEKDKSQKKRTYQIQRLNDFDLLSQW